MTRAPRRWLLAATAATLLALAAPGGSPAPHGGALAAIAAWCVLPGLAALYALATSSARPYRTAYVVGLAYLLAVSWSLRHVSWPGYVAVGVVGAVYLCLVVLWTRCRAGLGLPPALAFAAGVAATQWLRSHAPEISYPHAQHAHALYGFPAVLGPVRWGGEALANLLLAFGAAAAVDLFRAWRVARPAWGAARLRLGAAVLLWAAACILAPPRAAAPGGPPRTVRALVFEPGFAPRFQMDPRRFLDRVTERLARPTLRRAGPEAADPPDLVIWPETAYPVPLEGDPPRLRDRRWHVPLARTTRLLAGTARPAPAGVGRHATAILVAPDGALLGWQDKIVPVPGGETLPFAALLPDSWERALLSAHGVVGTPLNLRAGARRPPMATHGGVAFATLLCFDNAFDSVVRRAVAGGAQLLVVLSNESWYRGGAELEQMVAMTVFRALETGHPLIRCTVDGVTCHVRADGSVAARLAPAPAGGGPGQRTLEVVAVAGPGALPPLSWLHDVWALLSCATVLSVLWHRARSWARLRTSRPDEGA